MTAAGAPRCRVLDVALYERPVELRLPFRFGVITLTACPQAFARVRVELADGRSAEGGAAELMVPKWFDKRAQLSHEQNIDQLRWSAQTAAAALRASGPDAVFGLGLAMRQALDAAARPAIDVPPLAAGFGPALLERALIDALCRANACSFFDALCANLVGLDARLAPDLASHDIGAFLASLQPRRRVAARHTVGLLDPITDADAREPPRDGLPFSLAGAIRRYGHRAFKLKLGGDAAPDLERLRAIAAVLDRLPHPYLATLDGNEQFSDAQPVAELLARMREQPRLRGLFHRLAYVEQPIARDRALNAPVAAIDAIKPVIIDESDAGEASFLAARAAGYRGVSSKTCKGVFRALANAMRCRIWNEAEGSARYFMTGEDLTCQAGLAVQQDCALVAVLGLEHVERNGHHYVNGFAGTPHAEQQAFLAAHPSFYEDSAGGVRLAIGAGEIDLASLFGPGYASAALPHWDTLQPMTTADRLMDRSSHG